MKSKDNLKDLYPLTPMQEGMLLHSLYDERRGTFIEQISCSITGNFNVDLFEKSWNELFKRHDILRTILILSKASRPLQMVLKEGKINFFYQDIQDLDEHQQREFLENYQQKDRQKGFDWERDLLMRIAVFKTQTDRYEILWTHHHILMDGWSSSLLLGQLIEIYKALADGKSPNLSTTPPPYSYFVRWLEQQNTEAARHYWEQYLQAYHYPVGVPRSQFPKEGYESSTFVFDLEEQTTSQLEYLARQSQVTISSLVQSIWAVLLAKYHDVDDVIFGFTVSGRPPEIKGVEQMVGLFINTIPIRVRVEPHLTFVQLIQHVQEESITSKEYTYYSLADILTLSQHRSGLFDHVIVFQNYPSSDQIGNNLETTPYEFSVENTKLIEQINYDFSLIVTPGEQLKFRFLYNAKAFSAASLQRIESHLRNIIKAVLDTPESAISDIQIVGDRESKQLISEFNATDTVCNQEQTVVDLIERQADKTPDATAVHFADQNVSYRELIATSAKIAASLHREAQVQLGDLIGILLQPSERFVVAVLAVMKAGCGFLGLDPKAPIERNRAILRESGAKAAIADVTFSAELEDFPGSVFVMGHLDDYQSAPPEIVSTVQLPSPDDLAYVIFSSSSTGKPEGIAVNHRRLFHYISWCSKFYFRGRDIGNMPLFTSPAFNLTITSLFCPLVGGKTVVVVDREEIDETLRQIIELGDQIDTIKLTPSHISALKHLKRKQNAIRLAIVSGDEFHKEQVETLLTLNPDIEIYNEYSLTDVTIGCTASQVIHPDRITIGKPIDNTKVYILNRHLEPVPIGCEGEIHIAGSGFANGYWKNQASSAVKFIDHPLEPRGKLYRSGILGKWLEDGEIVFLGRKNDQVKLGEIKDTGTVLSKRKTSLQVTGLPQTQKKAQEIPNGPVETLLAKIWQDVLKIEKVGVYDDFFALGGHSLDALMLLSQVRKALGIEITLQALTEFSTIRALGNYISAFGIYNDRLGKRHMTLLNPERGRYMFALPGLGYGIGFKGLAQCIKSYSVCGLDFIEDDDPFARYIELLEETQPKGSYLLLGYCGGGNLAFELTKRLEHRGRQVSDIIMFDSAPRLCRIEESDATIQEHVDAEIAYYYSFIENDTDLNMLLNSPHFKAKHRTKMIAYIRCLNDIVNDGQIRANIHLIQSEENHQFSNIKDRWVNIITGNVSIYNGSGNHGDLLLKEHLQINAALVNEILERILQNQQASD